ncbi:MAG: Ornithine carbamoyltransferase [Verrucomicrobiota bacterium]|jgi:ornithine carbamoyltransferase
MKHLLSIESLDRQEIYEILELAEIMKSTRGRHESLPLSGQCWALIFSKSSTRTRVSFEVGIRELGADVMFLSAADIQLGRGEPIKDTARVMGRMLDGAVIRTFSQSDVEEFAHYSGIPTINALTDDEHPCQILADLQTIREKLGGVEGRSICFIGDGACNVPRSWIWAAAKLDFELRIAAPQAFQPDPDLLERIGPKARLLITDDPREAAAGADVLYTDVWVSMGKEQEAAERLVQLAPYQINEGIVRLAASDAIVMHCLPAYRGKEITEEVLEANADTLFDQAENRLHAQKAILQLLGRNP